MKHDLLFNTFSISNKFGTNYLEQFVGKNSLAECNRHEFIKCAYQNCPTKPQSTCNFMAHR